MVELFSLDGVSYMIPAQPRINLGLLLLEDVEMYGEGMANARHLKRLLGDEAFAALARHDGLTQEQLIQVQNAAQALTLGALEEAVTSGN